MISQQNGASHPVRPMETSRPTGQPASFRFTSSDNCRHSASCMLLKCMQILVTDEDIAASASAEIELLLW
jgi:hypothetical protein